MKLFLVLVYINYALLGVAALDIYRRSWTTAILWHIATPSSLATAFGHDELGRILLFINPFLYGAAFWLLWHLWEWMIRRLRKLWRARQKSRADRSRA